MVENKNKAAGNSPNTFFKIDARTIAGFIISGFLLWLMFRQSHLQWSEIQQTFGTFHATVYFSIACVLGLTVIFLQSVRTRIVFIDRTTTLSQTSAFPSLVIGYFYNNILPGNLGEGVRAWHFSRVNRKPFKMTLAVLTVEKFLDANIISPIILFTYLLIPDKSNYMARALLFMLVAVIGINILCPLLLRSKKAKRFLFSLLWKKQIRIFFLKVFNYHFGHLQRLWKNHNFKWYVVVAYVMYFLNGLQHFAILKAVDANGAMFNLSTFNLVNLCIMLVAVIPSAPANTGVAHYGIYIALLLSAQISGVESNLSQFALVAIGIHLSYFLPEVLLGIVYLIRERRVLFGK